MTRIVEVFEDLDCHDEIKFFIPVVVEVVVEVDVLAGHVEPETTGFELRRVDLQTRIEEPQAKRPLSSADVENTRVRRQAQRFNLGHALFMKRRNRVDLESAIFQFACFGRRVVAHAYTVFYSMHDRSEERR